MFRAQDVLCAADDAASIATFLIHMPGLDKKMIGEYLGDPAELSVNTLREYVEAIGLPTFPRLGFDDALRMFLQGFRLPGCARPRPLPTHATCPQPPALMRCFEEVHGGSNGPMGTLRFSNALLPPQRARLLGSCRVWGLVGGSCAHPLCLCGRSGRDVPTWCTGACHREAAPIERCMEAFGECARAPLEKPRGGRVGLMEVRSRSGHVHGGPTGAVREAGHAIPAGVLHDHAQHRPAQPVAEEQDEQGGVRAAHPLRGGGRQAGARAADPPRIV